MTSWPTAAVTWVQRRVRALERLPDPKAAAGSEEGAGQGVDVMSGTLNRRPKRARSCRFRSDEADGAPRVLIREVIPAQQSLKHLGVRGHSVPAVSECPK